jgi:flagellar protein FlgJ
MERWQVNPIDITAAAKVNLDNGVQAMQGLVSAAKNKRDPRELEKVAKDFEAVFLQKITDEMRKSVPQSGLLDSSALDQTQGIFWSELSQELGRQGGLGLWKQLVKEFQASNHSTQQTGATGVQS